MNEPAAPRLDESAERVIAQHEESFNRMLRAGQAVSTTESVRRIGYAYHQAGSIELALEYLELAQVLAELYDDRKSAAKALNGIATIYQASGQLASATASYDAARKVAELDGDIRVVADIDQNLGTLWNTRGDFAKAKRFYESSLTAYKSIGCRKGVSRVLTNMGVLWLDIGDIESAAVCLDEAVTLALSGDDIALAAAAFLNRADAFLAQGAADRARGCCDQAFELASRAADNRTRVEALKSYGTLYRSTGQFHLAEAHLMQAIALANEYSLPLTEAEAQRELARVLREQDRNREALSALNRAHHLFAGLEAHSDRDDVARKLSELHGEFVSTVSFWISSIEEKDEYTRGHCLRVAEYACVLADRVGLPKEVMVWFRIGALLHDVGKTAVPMEILLKEGSLTPAERLVIESHTICGEQLLSAVDFPWDIRPMIRSHHERWDGSGYPDRLAGPTIPRSARILSVADVFDALTTKRSYRNALEPAVARDAIVNSVGIFDPVILDAFGEVFDLLEGMAFSFSSDLKDAETQSMAALADLFQPPFS